MKQLSFKKQTPQGLVDGVLRIIGKDLYLKYKDNNIARQVINEFIAKGVKIEEGKGWIKYNFFKDIKVIDLKNDIIIDLDEDSDEVIEEKLFKFYKDTYNKQGFYYTIDTQ